MAALPFQSNANYGTRSIDCEPFLLYSRDKKNSKINIFVQDEQKYKTFKIVIILINFDCKISNSVVKLWNRIKS